MALTTDEEKRLQKIESALSEHATAIGNLAAKRQLSHVLTLLETRLTDIETRLTSIQSQLNAIKK